MSEKSFAELVKEEKQNRSMGILLVYPEFYLKKNQNGYKYKEVLALTDTMKESFLHYAAFVRRYKFIYFCRYKILPFYFVLL